MSDTVMTATVTTAAVTTDTMTVMRSPRTQPDMTVKVEDLLDPMLSVLEGPSAPDDAFNAKNELVEYDGQLAVARDAPAIGPSNAYATKYWAFWARVQGQRRVKVGGLIGFCDSKPPIIVREYYQNGTVTELLAEHVTTQPGDDSVGEGHTSRVRRLLQEAARELAVLHLQGFVHGNLKPSNMVVDDGGHVKLIDACGPAGGEWRWESGADSNGGRQWLAPELMSETNTPPGCTEASDVYALGKSIRGILEHARVDSMLDNQFLDRMCDADASTRPTALQVFKNLSPAIADAVDIARQKLEELDSKLRGKKLAFDDMEHPVYERIADLRNQLDIVPTELLIDDVVKSLERYYLLVQARQKQEIEQQQGTRHFCSVVCALALRRWVKRHLDLHTKIDSIVNESGTSSKLTSERYQPWDMLCDEIREKRAKKLVAELSSFGQTHCSKKELESTNNPPPVERLRAALMTCSYELCRPDAQFTEAEKEEMERLRAKLMAHEVLQDKLSLPEWFLPWYEVLQTDEDKIRGEGAFGKAILTTWNSTRVIIKVLKDTSEKTNTRIPAPSYLSKCSSASDEAKQPPTQSTAVTMQAAEDEKTAELIDEADLWFSLRSPRLVRLIGACHVTSRMFLCELAEHGSLDKYLLKRKKSGYSVGHDELWRLFYQITLGLRYLHDRGIAHGDLKPDNILITSDGRALVCDFGLTFEVQTDKSNNLETQVDESNGLKAHADEPNCLKTQTDEPNNQETQCNEASDLSLPPPAKGAYRYKAPERLIRKDDKERAPQLRSKPSEWLKSDVFSLAMCFVEAVTGEPPFCGLDDAMAKYLITRKNRPPRPKTFSKAEWALVTKMTAYSPADRPSMNLVLESIKTIVPSKLLQTDTHEDSVRPASSL